MNLAVFLSCWFYLKEARSLARLQTMGSGCVHEPHERVQGKGTGLALRKLRFTCVVEF